VIRYGTKRHLAAAAAVRKYIRQRTSVNTCEDDHMQFVRFAFTMAIAFLAIVPLHAAEGLNLPELADEPFAKEQWPQTRTLVWANPGVSGSMQAPKNWTEYASAVAYLAGIEGRPARNSPDKNTDIILPDSPSGRSYVIACIDRRGGDKDNPQLYCRHITIGKGAGLDGGCEFTRGRAGYPRTPGSDTPIGIYGNVTVNDGGYIYGPLVFLGGKDTYLYIGNSPEPLGRSWSIRKSNGASVTLLSKRYALAEGVTVRSGRLVLQSGSHLCFGVGIEARIESRKRPETGMFRKEAYIHVHKTGALEMHSGSRIGRTRQPEAIVADLRIEGLLQIGRPGEKCDQPAVIELGMAEGSGGFLTQHGGLYIGPSARVRNFGRLAITSYHRDSPATASKGISLFLEKAVELGDVSFDYLRTGGIVATDDKTAKAAAARGSFGKHCGAKGDALFSELASIDFQGGQGTVEFVDGLKTDCKILFSHAGRLIVRGKGNRTLQSFDLASVHTVTIDGSRTQFNPKRPLTEKEKELRRLNALWADVPGKGEAGRYGDQQWPDCPVMIWARPGTSGACSVGPNWLDETGRPYFEVPLISRRGVRSDTPSIDMLLPAADTPYAASSRHRRGSEGLPLYRHLTIERNACYGSADNLKGNLWMKHGSGLNGLTGSRGGEFANTEPGLHRFLRFDGKRIPYRGGGADAPLVDSRNAVLAQFGYFSTGDGGTLELIGQIRSAGDRLTIGGTGTMIISEGSELLEGSRSALWIGQGATLALLQDALVGTVMTQQRPQCYASMIVGGTLTIGLPDKPIRRDMRFSLNGIKENLINRNPNFSVRSTGCSFVLGQRGRFVIHSANPQKARAIFTMHDSERAIANDARYRAMASKARDPAYWNPEGIVCYFAGQTEVNGIVFDKVYPGGIIVAPETRAKWKNVFYASHNLAEPEKLYWKLETPK